MGVWRKKGAKSNRYVNFDISAFFKAVKIDLIATVSMDRPRRSASPQELALRQEMDRNLHPLCLRLPAASVRNDAVPSRKADIARPAHRESIRLASGELFDSHWGWPFPSNTRPAFRSL